jgi:hypothetical protein
VTQRSVSTDDRGAIALLAVFFVVFAVAALYSLVGSVDAILFRERMQDAADSAALSSAVMYARSMNFIVLVNIAMAALLAVLVALKLVEALCIIGAVIAAALAWPTFGASLAAIPPLHSVQTTAQEAYDSMKPPIDQALEVMNLTTDALKIAAPLAAAAVVQEDIDEFWKPPVERGFATGGELPIEDDAFDALCGRAGEFAGSVAMLPIKPIPGIGLLADPISGAVGELTQVMSGWFCGSSGGGSSQPPSVKHRDTLVYPRIAATDACASSADAAACSESELFEQRSAPDRLTGSCQSTQDCSTAGDYETRVTLAREQCAPTRTPAPYLYWYQTRTGRVSYEWKDERWVRGEPSYDEPRANPPDVEHPLPSSYRPPCGPAEVSPLIAEGYNLAVHPPGEPEAFLPVCRHEASPEHPPGPHDPLVRHVEFTEVLNILGCKINTEVTVDVSDGEAAPEGDGRAAKLVSTEHTLGDEAFQIRALMQGSFDAERSGSEVRRALWRRPPPEDPLAELRNFGSYSVAQSEFFYDGTEGRADWMWNMKWRARLRRFRMPDSDAFPALALACGLTLGGECPSALGHVGVMSPSIMH